MATREVVLFGFILYILLIFCQAHLISLSDVNRFEGSRSGETLNGLNQVKNYLIQLGYLTYDEPTNIHGEDDYFDDGLESAIKTYQQYYQLNVTGILDKETIKVMAAPRCGMRDITPSQKHYYNTFDHHFNATSHFTFFPDAPRWPAIKSHLTYYFVPPYKTESSVVKVAFVSAFSIWSLATKGFLTFQEVEDFNTADLKIKFVHIDNGSMGTADPPTGGWLYLTEDRKWIIGLGPDSYDLVTAALHLIGHLLGLAHSSVKEAVMYPIIFANTDRKLHNDDVLGIRVLYEIH